MIISFWLVLIELLIANLVSDRFFSRLAKYLLFFSSCSTMFAFYRMISPFSLVSVIFSNVLLFSSSCSFNNSILLASEDSEISFCNFLISLFSVFFWLICLFFLECCIFYGFVSDCTFY